MKMTRIGMETVSNMALFGDDVASERGYIDFEPHSILYSHRPLAELLLFCDIMLVGARFRLFAIWGDVILYLQKQILLVL